MEIAAKKFSRSVVKDQGHSEVINTFTAEGYAPTYGRPSVVRAVEACMLIDGVASRMTSVFACIECRFRLPSDVICKTSNRQEPTVVNIF